MPVSQTHSGTSIPVFREVTSDFGTPSCRVLGMLMVCYSNDFWVSLVCLYIDNIKFDINLGLKIIF